MLIRTGQLRLLLAAQDHAPGGWGLASGRSVQGWIVRQLGAIELAESPQGGRSPARRRSFQNRETSPRAPQCPKKSLLRLCARIMGEWARRRYFRIPVRM